MVVDVKCDCCNEKMFETDVGASIGIRTEILGSEYDLCEKCKKIIQDQIRIIMDTNTQSSMKWQKKYGDLK